MAFCGLIELVLAMEFRLISDPLLRSRMSPLLSYLAPSIPPLWRLSTASRQARLLMPTSPGCRSSGIHTTARQRAQSSSNAADLDFLEDKPGLKPKPTMQSASPQRRPTDNVIDNRINSLLDSTFHTPTLAKRKPQTAADLSELMMDTASRNSMRHRDPKKYHEIAKKMAFPTRKTAGAGNPTLLSDEAFQSLGVTRRTPKRAQRTVRSRPAVGRTIDVLPDRGVDVGRAMKNLDIACAVNKVRQDLARQRFHERPGIKRKRLKSERYRKMFMESFKAVVMRVKEMRRKGW